MSTAMTKSAIERVFEIVGSEAEVARRLEVSSEAVRKWKRRVPPPRARQLEELTGGVVTRYDLRPDIFGDLADSGAPDPKSVPLDGEGERQTDHDSGNGSSASPGSSDDEVARRTRSLFDEEAA